KWTDLDTNGNGTLDAADTSPFLPDRSRPLAGIGLVVAGQPITVDVTAAFQAGPGLYSLVIAGGSANEATYASRESTVAAQRPRPPRDPLPAPPGARALADQALPPHPQLGPVGAHRPDPAPRDRLEAPPRRGDQRQPPPAPPRPDPLRARHPSEDPPRHDQDP